ncbi:hypothetical protein DAI22_12g122500 [Oryza sativa Japonica Group]|nr:hypothetical protein DAI22_12g122500 [Oryza sativa Japonica Group]
MAIGPAEVFRTLLNAPYVTKRTRLYNILLFLVCLLGKFWFIILQRVGLAVLARLRHNPRRTHLMIVLAGPTSCYKGLSAND